MFGLKRNCLVDFNRNLQSPVGLLYLPPIVCFPIHLQFPPFSFGPLTSKKGTCLLLITVLLTSLSALLCSALLKLVAFYASVLHVAPFFFCTSHTWISNRKLHVVSHGLTLSASVVDFSDGNQGRLVNRVPLSVRDCQPHICDTGNGLDFITIQARE